MKINVTIEQYEALKEAELSAAKWNEDNLFLSKAQEILGIKIISFTSYEIVIEEERK